MVDSSSEQNSVPETKIWAENNIFLKNISFSSNQVFPLEGLSYRAHQRGSIIFANGSTWDVLQPDKNNQVLTFNSRGLSWQTPSLTHVSGVLPVSKGGTGWSLFPDSGILINTGKEILDLLPLPQERKLLIGQNKSISWCDLSELSDEISKNIKTLNFIGNESYFEQLNPKFFLKDRNKTAFLNLDSNTKKLELGITETDGIVKKANLEFDLNKSEIKFNINNKNVFTIDENNVLENVKINVSQLNGYLPLSSGGLGGIQVERGDLLFAKSSNEIGIISAKDSEGHYLKILNGVPTFAALDKSGFDGNLEVPLTLSATKNGRPPLTIAKSDLMKFPSEGFVEYDGQNLYLTNIESRKTFAFTTSDISGTASNVTGIVEIKNGGTGKDLSDLAIGQIIVKNHNELTSFEQGKHGQILMSQGTCSLPSWRDAVIDISTEDNSGINLISDSGHYKTAIDQSINFNPNWQGKHTFIQSLNLKSQLKLTDDKKAPLNFCINKNISELNTGDIWFDGENLNLFNGTQTINLSKPNVAQAMNVETIQSHYLTLAAGADVSEGRKIRMKTPVPHMSTKGSLANASWRVRRLEIILDEPAVEENAIFTLKCGDKILIDRGNIPLSQSSIAFENFENQIVITGEMLNIECLKNGGSNYWSAFLLIDLL